MIGPMMHSSPTPSILGRFDRPFVLGGGPVGRALAATLVGRGHVPTVVTRSGTDIQGSISRTADLSDPDEARDALRDATIVFSAAQPAYHRWAEEFPALQASIVAACLEAGVPLMVVENLYGYGPHDGALREDTPMRPTTKKGRVRAEMWQSLRAASVEQGLAMAVVRASDFIGPGVEGSAYGERFFSPIAAGKAAETIGDLDARHSVTYVPDLAEALVRVAEDDTAWGRAWHAPSAPAVSQRELAAMAAAVIGQEVKVKAVPIWMLRVVGLLVKPAAETVEMRYEFESDFVIDSSAFTQRFGMEATPLAEAVESVMNHHRSPLEALR